MPRTRSILLTLLLLCGALPLFAQKSYTLKSPDGQLSVTVRIGEQLTYTVSRSDSTILEPSQIALELLDGRTLGVASRLRDTRSRSVDETIDAPFYKRSLVEDRYNELTLRFRDRFSVEFRAYDEAVAYRFVTDFDEPYVVKNEIARFEFGADCPIHIPYARTRGPITRQYNCTFENVYTTTTLRETNPEKLAFLPVVVEKGGCQVCIAEADVEHYPGMFVWNPQHETALTGHFAPLPDKVEQGGYNFLQGVVLSRHPYIAPCDGARTLPWRIVIVAAEARQLADNDMVYRLASPSRVEDTSWIRPGKVAWEWWNACCLKEVDFEAGINNATYKAYIDFAAKYGIEYILLDDGWSERGKADLMRDANAGWGSCSGPVTRPSTATWSASAPTTPRWASRDSRSTTWTTTTRRSSISTTGRPRRRPATTWCSTSTEPTSPRGSTAPIPTCSISKASTGWSSARSTWATRIR